MVVCFSCSQETKQLLDTILRSGGYRDYGELIATAIANLSILQGEVARTGAIVIGNTQEVPVAPTPQASEPFVAPPFAPAPAAPPSASPAPERKTARNRPVVAAASMAQTLPERLVRNGLNKPSATPAAFPDDVWAPGATVPLAPLGVRAVQQAPPCQGELPRARPPARERTTRRRT